MSTTTETPNLKQRKLSSQVNSNEIKLNNDIKPLPNYSVDDNSEVIKKLTSLSKEFDQKAEGISYYFFHSILILIYVVMAIYRTFEFSYNKIKLRLLNLAYNPSKTPLLINEDIKKLAKIPKRVSSILTLKLDEDENGGVSGLLNDSSELVAWCLCSGVHELSLYERNGALKKNVFELRHSIYKKLVSYFGVDDVPSILIKIPHLNLIYYGFDDSEEQEFLNGSKKLNIEISLLSVIDGRSTIVDLTKIVSELTLKKELKMEEIKIQFIDKELTDLVGPEPDLLILFQPSLDLQGYPPWHIRLTEIYWEQDNDQVDYSVFYRLFKKYATCKVNVGK